MPPTDTIPAESSNTAPLVPPVTQPDTLGTLLNTANTNNKNSQNALDTANTEYTNLLTQLSGQQGDYNTQLANSGYNTFNKELSDLNALQTQQQAGYLASLNRQNTGAVSLQERSIGEQAVSRQHGIDALLTNSLIQAKRGQINQALATVKSAIDAKYEPIRAQLEAKKFILDQLNTKAAEDRKLALDLQMKQLEKQQADETAIQNIGLEIAKNGGDPSIIKGAKTVNDAIIAAGNSLRTPNTEVVKIGDNQAYLIDKNTGKIIRTFGSTPPPTNGGGINSQYSGIVDTILGSGKFTKDQATAIRNAINSGDDPLTVIKNNAKNIMGQAEATKLSSLESSRDAFNAFADSLQKFYDAGGSTSLLSGNFEKVINKLGAVRDPKLVELATELQGNIQAYRNAISGTAYSEQEGKDIASIFPGINKSQSLNSAITTGRKKFFDSSIDGLYRSALGSAYDKLKNTGKTIPKGNLSDKDFITQAIQKSGRTYESIVNDTPKGQIPVVDNATGQVGWIPYLEFITSKYTKL